MKIYPDFDLTAFNSYRLHANCKKAYFPESEEDVIDFFSNRKDPYILIGSGHNIILSKTFYDTDFLIFNGNYNRYRIDPDQFTLEAEAGVSMLELCEAAWQHSCSGLEVFYDIPSSLGGAVVMNAGASGEEIKDLIVKVRYLDLKNMQVKEVWKEAAGFEYRNSFFQRNTENIVLKALLRLVAQDKDVIKEKMDSVKALRWQKQPRDFPNAGSVFKRPKGHYVGPMMEALGLKGFAVGGAKVSEKHGGFIVNFNQATGQDILDLIAHIKERVFEAYAIELEVEQRIL